MRKTFEILMLQQRLRLREGEAPAEPGLESDFTTNSRLGRSLAASPSRTLAGWPSSPYVCTDVTVDVFRCFRTRHLVFRMAGWPRRRFGRLGLRAAQLQYACSKFLL